LLFYENIFIEKQQSGRKFYGFCFTKWTRISKRKMYFIKKRLARDGFVGLITSLYAPICMCIVSQFPLHQSFKKFFTAMIQTLKPSNKFGSELLFVEQFIFDSEYCEASI